MTPDKSGSQITFLFGRQVAETNGLDCAGLRTSYWCSSGLHGCPCGHFSDPARECRCTGAIIQRYLGKISGPLLDRIDLHIEVPAVPYQELRGKADGATSAQMRARVEEARSLQQSRGFYNAQIPVAQLRRLCALDDAGERTLEMAVRRISRT